jgi:hypothetical protein
MKLPGSVAPDLFPQNMESPVFLIGSERSGTTLLRLMLDHHPDIAFNLESEYLVSHISDAGVFPDVADYRRKLQEDRVFKQGRFDLRDDLDFPALAHDFLRQKRDRDGKRIIGATVHYGFSKLRYLWPRARYIYLLRDGRDVACSVVEMGWAGNAFAGAQWWIDAEREWTSYRRSLGNDRWIEVRYEELIANCEGTLRRICVFIGVDFSERMFDYAQASSYSLPDPAQAYKWRRRLLPKELTLLEARIGSQLVARGYELGCEAPPRIGAVRATWLQWQSRLKVLLHKIEMFGFCVIAFEFISRRLGITRVRSRAQRTIDAIVDQHLK